MDHIDWVGISTCIAALAAACVSVLGALRSYKNGRDIEKVRDAADGLTSQLVAQARAQGLEDGLRAAQAQRPAPPAV